MEEHSWYQPVKGKLTKNLDFSSFNHRTSVIPKEFYNFFNLDSDSKDKLKINLVNKTGKSFKSYIRHVDKSRSTPAKLIVWDKDFDIYLKLIFPQWININKGEKTQNYKLTFTKTKITNEYIVSTEVNQIIGIKKIRDSEIGNKTSHATHIGLYQNVLTNKEEHQTIPSKIYFENSVFPTVSFIDFIKRKDGTFNAPKVRKGTEEDNYQINGVGFESAFVKFQEIFHSRKEDKSWYLIFRQNNKKEIEFFLILEESQEFIELFKIFGDSLDRKEITEGDRGYEDIVNFINLNFNIELIPILDVDIELENNGTEDSDNSIIVEGFIDSQRREYETHVTDKKLRDKVLEIYRYKCQFCNNKNEYINSNLERVHYAEGAHVKAKNPKIGGSDSLDNLMCLCATCHALFDLGALWVDEEFTVRGLDGEVVNQLTVKHDIDQSNFEFHRDYFENRRNLN